LNTPIIYYRFALGFVLCVCLSLGASAQKLFPVKGITIRKATTERVPQVIVTNQRTKTIAMSDELGVFTIEAAMEDTLLFKKTDYTPQTMVVFSTLDMSVYLQPVIILKEVTVKDISKKQELENTMNDYKRTGQYYTLNPSAWSVMSSPLTGLYELFKEELEREAIAKRYNRRLVKQVTNIPDSDLDAFMLAFTPSYEDIKIWSDYDIITYIKKSYEYFQNNKDKLKVEKLY
jgi:hypothetical protein